MASRPSTSTTTATGSRRWTPPTNDTVTYDLRRRRQPDVQRTDATGTTLRPSTRSTARPCAPCRTARRRSLAYTPGGQRRPLQRPGRHDRLHLGRGQPADRADRPGGKKTDYEYNNNDNRTTDHLPRRHRPDGHLDKSGRPQKIKATSGRRAPWSTWPTPTPTRTARTPTARSAPAPTPSPARRRTYTLRQRRPLLLRRGDQDGADARTRPGSTATTPPATSPPRASPRAARAARPTPTTTPQLTREERLTTAGPTTRSATKPPAPPPATSTAPASKWSDHTQLTVDHHRRHDVRRPSTRSTDQHRAHQAGRHASSTTRPAGPVRHHHRRRRHADSSANPGAP